MGKATVVFYDDENGDTHIVCEYDPPLKKGQGIEGAQSVAFELMQGLTGAPGSEVIRQWSGLDDGT